MTRAELRRDLSAFRAMVRERGPRECLEVAAVRWTPQWLADAHPLHSEEYWQAYRDWCFVQKLPRRCALAALRWWRWANRDWRFVTVSEPSVSGTGLYVRWYSENNPSAD